jgi:hypothetical protein
MFFGDNLHLDAMPSMVKPILSALPGDVCAQSENRPIPQRIAPGRFLRGWGLIPVGMPLPAMPAG